MDFKITDESNVIAAANITLVVHPKLVDGKPVMMVGNDTVNFELEMARQDADAIATGIFQALDECSPQNE